MPFQPIDASDACFRRSGRLLDLAGADIPYGKVKNDLRRSALVMAIAGIDSYMHWLVYKRLSEVRKQADLPKSLAGTDLPFIELASLADAAIEGRKEKRVIRPWVQVKNAIQRRLLRETFQSYEQIGKALSLAGVERGPSRVADKLRLKPEKLQSKLNHLVHRRNQVVHEGDIKRASRPRKLKYNKIVHDDIVAGVNWIRSLVRAIQRVVQEGNPA